MTGQHGGSFELRIRDQTVQPFLFHARYYQNSSGAKTPQEWNLQLLLAIRSCIRLFWMSEPRSDRHAVWINSFKDLGQHRGHDSPCIPDSAVLSSPAMPRSVNGSSAPATILCQFYWEQGLWAYPVLLYHRHAVICHFPLSVRLIWRSSA